MSNVQMTPILESYYQFRGGLDLITPALSIPPGVVFDALNYEIDAIGIGYRRINGFERFSGLASPHNASYWIVSATISEAPVYGNTLTGVTSGATGIVLTTTATTIVMATVTGTFSIGENLQVGGVTKAVATSVSTQNSADTVDLDSTYLGLAADYIRSLISAVPGSGAIRGVWLYNDVVYAFRDNAGATAGTMWKSTSSGWTQITFEYEVQFTAGGTVTPADGATLTQGGVTATVRRVMRRTGTWAAGTAAGTMIISVTAGGNFASGAATLTGGAGVTLSGIQTSIALPAGGRYEFVNYNFTGSESKWRMYGCNGVSTAFEFDGTYFCTIRTGMTLDTPTHITAHKNHLFLSFKSSAQHSSIGSPYEWAVVTGSAEIACGDTITQFLPMTGDSTTGAMEIFTETQCFTLYGTSSANWNLITTSPTTGCKAYSAQLLGNGVFMSERGIQNISTTLSFGDFDYATISQQIQPYINDVKGLVTESCALKSKGQYRCFFSDGRALSMTMVGNKVAGFLPLDYGIPIRCYCVGEMSDGSEVSFFGSDDGYVYQDNVGTSFDGEAIESWVRFAFNNFKSPRMRKRFRRLVFEMSVEKSAQLSVSYELGYGTPDVDVATVSALGGGGYWDQFTWDQFYWDAQSVADASISLEGTEKNMSLIVYSDRAIDQPHTLQGAIVHYSMRRVER